MIQSIPTNSGVAPGGAVGGASNLTTVGAIPYVSSSGVLNQDATKLFWDSANSRLGVGTASPGAPLEVAGQVQANSFYQRVNTTFFIGTQYDTALRFYVNSAERAQFAPTTYNLLLGGTTDGNYKLDVQKSGTTGTLRVYDQTAVTGSTRAVIQAGAGQSGNVLEVLDSGGGFLSGINSVGASIFAANQWLTSLGGDQRLYFTASGASYLKSQNSIGFRTLGDVGVMTIVSTSVIKVPSGSVYSWSNAANSESGTIDLGLARNAAGILEINNGTAGTLRDLLLRYLQNTGVTVATLPAAAAGNAGSRAYVTDANATTIGSTVAGGGSNKVMVWSNGTNWKIYAS